MSSAIVTAPRIPGGTAPKALTRLPSLTGLRWLAAFLVWGFHLRHVIPVTGVVLEPVFHAMWNGAIGVSFFFVLSGFVLVWSFREGDTTRAFLQRRFAKIYPNHAFALLLMLVLLAVTGVVIDRWAVLSNALLINAWMVQPGYPNAVNAVAWTLCCEAFFYVTLPFLLPRLRRLSTDRLYVLLAFVPIAALLLNTLLDRVMTINLGFFPPARYHEFLVGVLVGELVVRGRWSGPGLWKSTALVVVAYTVHAWADVSIVIPVAFAALIAAATRADLTGQRSPWRWRPLVLLGEASYAFYLVHWLVLKAGVAVLNHMHVPSFGPGPQALFAGATLLVALLLAFAMYHWLEVPMMKLLRPRPRRARYSDA